MKRWLSFLLALAFAVPAFAQTEVRAKGYPYSSAVSITRPSNTTAYNAGDVIGVADAAVAANAGSAIHTFAGICASGGTTLITSADLTVNVTSIPSGMTSFRLHLYNVSPTAILDNAVWDLPAGDRAPYLGYIDVGTPVDVGATLFVQSTQVNQQFKCAVGSTSLYGELVTNGGYTPSSGGVKTIRLQGVGL